PDKREVSGSTPLRPITEKKASSKDVTPETSRGIVGYGFARRCCFVTWGGITLVLRRRAAALLRAPLRESSSDDRWPRQDPYSQTRSDRADDSAGCPSAPACH